jgi:predicted RNA binding protein YcfA (HicA-like mRNA interferase family)
MALNDNRRAVLALAKKYGFILHRETKHYIFKHKSGKILVTSKSSMDRHLLKNIEGNIRRILNQPL